MKAFLLSGTSMWPVLKNGDLALVDPDRPPVAGDLVLRFQDGMPVVHRYLGDDTTKGDRYPSVDSRVSSDERLGVVVCVTPRRMASKTGRMHSASLFDRPLLATQLNSWQTKISIRHANCASRSLRTLALIALITTGFALRLSLYLSAQGSTHAA